jgi:hypothetical protein
LAKRILFSTETANHRSINEYIRADGLKSCQLVLVVTNLKQGSIWNTTPGCCFPMNYASTDNTAQLRADPDRNASILARIPANRWGTPEDLTGAFVFLSSPASDYVNGTILTVDGGWMGR